MILIAFYGMELSVFYRSHIVADPSLSSTVAAAVARATSLLLLLLSVVDKRFAFEHDIVIFDLDVAAVGVVVLLEMVWVVGSGCG